MVPHQPSTSVSKILSHPGMLSPLPGQDPTCFAPSKLHRKPPDNMLAPPGGLARAGTRSTVTTCDVYPHPFVVLVVMVLILTVFFHIKSVFFRSRLHIMFSYAIDHWMFWPCPNVSFFRQIWRKNLQSPVIYSVSIWHDLPCMLFGGVWLGASCCGSVEYLCHHFFRAGSSCLFLFWMSCMSCSVPWIHKKPKVHTPTLPWRSIQHVWNFQKRDCIPTPTPPQPAHDTPATYRVYTWTHQQRTMNT